MRAEELYNGMSVISRFDGTEMRVICANALMKDSNNGWVSAVMYAGPDKYSIFQENRTFCKNKKDFLKEFEMRL